MILRLTHREAQVIKLTTEGYLYKSVADVLGISPRTVEALSRTAQERNECKTLPQIAARYAVASLTNTLKVSKAHEVSHQTRKSKPDPIKPATHDKLMTVWSSQKDNQK